MSDPFTDVMLENLTPHAAGAKSEDLNQSGHFKNRTAELFLLLCFLFCFGNSSLW